MMKKLGPFLGMKFFLEGCGYRRFVKENRGIYQMREEALDELSSEIRANTNPRDFVRQGEPNDQDFYVNAQTLINISRRRLCNTASKETREAWKLVVQTLKENVDPIIADFLVPNCIYRGFCPEVNSCGFCKTEKYKKDLNNLNQNEISVAAATVCGIFYALNRLNLIIQR